MPYAMSSKGEKDGLGGLGSGPEGRAPRGNGRKDERSASKNFESVWGTVYPLVVAH